jgi:hypothetical protein
MSYSNPQTITLNFGLVDFSGGGADTFSFKLPKGKVGKLRDVMVSATEVFNAVTTEAEINIGSAESGEQYANCGLGTLADKASYQLSNTPADLVKADLPKDTNIWVAFVANTGGTPSGIGFVSIVIDVF